MKKILLSVAIIATTIVGANAQIVPTTCPGAVSAGDATEYAIGSVRMQDASGTKVIDETTNGSLSAIVNQDQTSSVVYIAPSTDYTLRVSTVWASAGRPFRNQTAWIDYNNNGVFDASEEVYATLVANSGSIYTGENVITFTTPSDLIQNQAIRMRISAKQAVDGTVENDIVACEEIAVGGTVDYALIYSSITPPKAVGDVLSSVQDAGEVELKVLDNDVAGTDPIDGIVLDRNPDNGIAEIKEGKLFYTPTAGYKGLDYIQYHVTANGEPSEVVDVKVVVYGYKTINEQNVLVIDDFENFDERYLIPGTADQYAFIDDEGLAWDGSFNQGNPDFQGKSDNGLVVFEGANAISYEVIGKADADVSVNDPHSGRKVSAVDYNTKLHFTSDSDNSVLGMFINTTANVNASFKAGFGVKELNSNTVHFVKTSLTELTTVDVTSGLFPVTWYFVTLDLSTLIDASTDAPYVDGVFALHSLGFSVEAGAGNFPVTIDALGLYQNDGNLATSKDIKKVVSVYPNPVKNVLTVSAAKGAKVIVLNSTGNAVFTGQAGEISTNLWSKGIYFVVVEEGTEKSVIKIVK